jgi:hypothetical protein
MTELYEGSVSVEFGFEYSDLDSMKAQIEDIVLNGAEPPLSEEQKESVEKVMVTVEDQMYVGLRHAGMWLANKASVDAPKKTGRLSQSGSVWVKNQRVYITGGGTHPDIVDTPELSVIIVFNTPYAFIQDTEYSFNHPGGGRAGYLTGNLEENHGIIQEIMFSPLRDALLK